MTIVRVDIDFAKNVVGSQSVRTAALWYEPLVAVGASAPGRDRESVSLRSNLEAALRGKAGPNDRCS